MSSIYEQYEHITFYLDRLLYYRNMLCNKPKELRGYGEIEFYFRDLDQVQQTLDHWLQGFIECVQKAKCIKCTRGKKDDGK